MRSPGSPPAQIRRASLASPEAGRLIAALNAELTAAFPEPGANHFSLDEAQVADGEGAFVIAYADDVAVGCGAVRQIDKTTAELKRMYVDPSVRGRGIGRAIIAALEREARLLGVTRIVLETGTRLAPAIRMYEAMGYARIPLFGEYLSSPDTSVCLGKWLPAPFLAHVELLRVFLTQREEIVESIEAVLTAQRKPAAQGSALSRQLEDCFFARTAVTASQARLRGQLEEAHWAGGFKPRQVRHVHNDLIHPAEMMIRGVHCWQQTRWPGRNGRIHYSHTLFNLYVLRCLQFLSMRLWDEDAGEQAGGRLAQIQGVLDELWRSSPAGQPPLVRDARWLIPLAQSLITDELTPYFEVAQRVTETLPEADGLEIQKAHARMLGGHLASQIRYYCTQDGVPGVPIGEQSVVVRTRTSNALDLALLVQDLVGLLQAYDRAVRSGDERMRLDMAGAIYQGISPDPELFLNRVDMLGAYSTIEHVFVARDREGHAVYSALGQRHAGLLKEYGALMGRLRTVLRDDLPRFRPIDGSYSPYGVLFGLPSNLIEHMALKALEREAETRFSLEDVFHDGGEDGETGAAKLAWVNGWRKLPHIDGEVQRLYDYPQQFAEDIYGRIEHELRRPDDGSRTGRLYIVCGDDAETDSAAIPDVPARYFVSSDRQIVAAHKAEPYDAAQLLRERQEGHFLVSYETPGGWMALKKNLLAEVLGAGRDARIAGLPIEAAQVLWLMCASLRMEN